VERKGAEAEEIGEERNGSEERGVFITGSTEKKELGRVEFWDSGEFRGTPLKWGDGYSFLSFFEFIFSKDSSSKMTKTNLVSFPEIKVLIKLGIW
jgi:hypothetical protein